MKVKPSIEDFANCSTIHGVSYVFSKASGSLDRLLWFLVMLAVSILASFMVSQAFINWRSNPVITTLKTTSKPISEISYPSITFCAQGLHMDLAEKALFREFLIWKKNKLVKDVEAVKLFMLEKFQIEESMEMNILDILSTMVLPDTSAENSIRRDLNHCSKAKRKKRNIGQNFFHNSIYFRTLYEMLTI